MSFNIKCTLTNVLYQKFPEIKQTENIFLLQRLSKSTEWVKVIVTGNESILSPGDLALISSRPTSFTFTIDGQVMHNIEDKAIIAFKDKTNTLRCTNGTFLYSWVNQQEEEVSAGGIILKTKPRDETAWAKVHAVGPLCGFNTGDEVLIKFHNNAYSLEIDGEKMYNAGHEEVICYRRNNE